MDGLNFQEDAKKLLEGLPDLYLFLSPNFCIVGASQNYLKVTFIKKEEILGKNIFDVLFANDEKNSLSETNLRISLEKVLEEKVPNSMAIQKFMIRRPEASGGDLELRFWSILNSPLLDKDNDLKYIIHRIEDVTQFIKLQESQDKKVKILSLLSTPNGEKAIELIKRAESIQELNRKLSETESYNSAFLAAIPDAMLLANRAGEIEFINNQVEEMFGYSKEELYGKKVELLMPESFSKYHPQHRDNYFKSSRVRPMGLGMELKARRKNGDIFPVEISLSPLPTKAGLAAIAVIRDVTRRAEQNQLLLEKEKSIRELYQVVEEEKSHLETFNEKMFLMTQLSETMLACKNYEEILESFASFANKILGFAEGSLYLIHNSRDFMEKKITWGKSNNNYPLTFTLDECWALRRGCIYEVSDKQPGMICQHIKVMKKPCRDSLCIPLLAQNEILGLLFIYITPEFIAKGKQHTLIPVIAETFSLAIANIRLKELLHLQSMHDPLTGLLNRRFLEEYMLKQLGQAKRMMNTIAFILMDLDDFKQINDSYGHEKGDEVLIRVADLLKSVIREGDLGSRYGGEEFLLVFTHCGISEAKKVTELLRKKIEKMIFKVSDQSINITASFGISIFPNHGTNLNELIRAADKALYAAKKEGKNQSFVYSGYGGEIKNDT